MSPWNLQAIQSAATGNVRADASQVQSFHVVNHRHALSVVRQTLASLLTRFKARVSIRDDPIALIDDSTYSACFSQSLDTGAQICWRFGTKLRLLRESEGCTQAHLADRLGLQHSFIANMEQGNENVSLDWLETIASQFDLSVSALLAGL